MLRRGRHLDCARCQAETSILRLRSGPTMTPDITGKKELIFLSLLRNSGYAVNSTINQNLTLFVRVATNEQYKAF
jgi:hypothetical protein